MNTHLSESELIDLAEDVLDSRRAAHVESCAGCREQAEALRAMLHDTAAIEAPDPSPLFWEHLSARVRGAIAAEPAAGRAWLGLRGLVPLAAAAAVVIAVFSGVHMVRAGRGGPLSSLTIAGPAADTSAASDGRGDAMPDPDPDNAAAWDVLTAAASTVEFEDAHAAGMHVYPGAIEHAVAGLSPAELTELGRLLQSELKRSSN
jgi:hypothetical protein